MILGLKWPKLGSPRPSRGVAAGTASPPSPMPVLGPAAERRALVNAVRDWGYFGGDGVKNRRDLWHGARLLDVGMGGGPHSVAYVESGVRHYIGVDPVIGTKEVRDMRHDRAPAIYPAYHAFPFSAADIMRLYPNIHLYPNLFEEVAPAVKAHRPNVAIMSAVSEHLDRPADVIRAIWEALEPEGLLWLCHCNYYSWFGHHQNPRSLDTWDADDAEQASHVDWKHLDPAHGAYADPTLNRIRLDDLRALIDKYFEIVDWRMNVDALSRLTPEIRARWRRFSLGELLGRDIFISARRRDRPLATDLSDRQFFHPSESYGADRDYLFEDIAPFRDMNFVFFDADSLNSHSNNDYAGARLFDRMKPGDIVTVRKHLERRRFTVAAVDRADVNLPRLKLVERVSQTIRDNYDEWSIET